MATTNTRETAADNGTGNGTETAATAPATADPGTGTTPAPNEMAGAVWDALTANPGASAAVIATAAGVSGGAARRALTALESAGQATRTRGGRDGGKRTPDTWNPVTPDTETGITDSGTAEEPDTTEAPTEPGTDEPDAAEVDDAAETGMEAAAVTEASDALAEVAVAISEALHALDGGDRAAALTAAEVIYGGSGKARRLIRTAANGRPRSASGKARSHPGELRAKVAGHLAAHPGKEFTPHEVAKVIGHSAGAVANALDRLTALGDAVATCDRPRRFTAPTTDADTGAATAATA